MLSFLNPILQTGVLFMKESIPYLLIHLWTFWKGTPERSFLLSTTISPRSQKERWKQKKNRYVWGNRLSMWKCMPRTLSFVSPLTRYLIPVLYRLRATVNGQIIRNRLSRSLVRWPDRRKTVLVIYLSPIDTESPSKSPTTVLETQIIVKKVVDQYIQMCDVIYFPLRRSGLSTGRVRN